MWCTASCCFSVYLPVHAAAEQWPCTRRQGTQKYFHHCQWHLHQPSNRLSSDPYGFSPAVVGAGRSARASCALALVASSCPSGRTRDAGSLGRTGTVDIVFSRATNRARSCRVGLGLYLRQGTQKYFHHCQCTASKQSAWSSDPGDSSPAVVGGRCSLPGHRARWHWSHHHRCTCRQTCGATQAGLFSVYLPAQIGSSCRGGLALYLPAEQGKHSELDCLAVYWPAPQIVHAAAE